jgi:anti-anti-sigma regulatory factor
MAAGDYFDVATEESAAGNLLILSGPIGMDATPRLHAEAQRLASRSGDVAVDWTQAEYLGAGAVQVLLALRVALAENGRKLHVAADRPAIRESLELAGISGHFPAERRE